MPNTGTTLALLRRHNDCLRAEGAEVHSCKSSSRQHSAFGDFWIEDLEENTVKAHRLTYADVEVMASQHVCLEIPPPAPATSRPERSRRRYPGLVKAMGLDESVRPRMMATALACRVMEETAGRGKALLWNAREVAASAATLAKGAAMLLDGIQELRVALEAVDARMALWNSSGK